MRWVNILFGCILLGPQVALGLPAKNDSARKKDDPKRKGGIGIFNWYGTKLYGFDGCDKIPHAKEWINEAYADAIKLVDYDGVKENIRWDSAAALEYLGPDAFNKDQQKQIQAVFANVATVKPGFWPPQNYIRARCDDPARQCSFRCPETQEDEGQGDVIAYARNPKQAGGKYPDISFCPPFYGQRNLGNAIAFGSGVSNPRTKNDLTRYRGRADTFLHELLHLDLAADSVKGSPNPQIRDLRIRYRYTDGGKEVRSRFVTAYGPKHAKILARFQPISPSSKQTGYFVQRNDDNLGLFALANYVQQKIKSYPFLPVIHERDVDTPSIPAPRESMVTFTADGNKPATLNFTLENPFRTSDSCISGTSTNGKDQDLEIGAPNPADKYPKSYWDERKKWLDQLGGSSNKCSLHIEEIWTCEPSDKNLYANMRLEDKNGKVIYATPGSAHSPGVPINDAHPYKLKEPGMKNTLEVTGEHQKDYIQFVYGSTKWTSGDKSGAAHCKLKGDDWNKKGPGECPNMALSREFDCEFPC